MITLQLRRGKIVTSAGMPLVMGIVNVTPDSFSDGGVNFDRTLAVAAALRMAHEGAAIVDIGGESTRPGSERVSEEEELRRVIPVIEAIRRESEVAISIDTMKARVAEAALSAGADIVNDVSALRYDNHMTEVIAKSGAAVILMHMRGEPKTMQTEIRYDDLMKEISSELESFVEAATKAGIGSDRVLIDPGIGFGKTFEHNCEILRRVDELTAIAPVVIGASRKAFIGHLTGREGGRPRLAGSLAAVAAAATGGAAVVRVHDVAETVDFIKVLERVTG